MNKSVVSNNNDVKYTNIHVTLGEICKVVLIHLGPNGETCDLSANLFLSNIHGVTGQALW